MPYIDTFYARTLADKTVRASLQTRIRTDVCVVGGGLAGLTAALTLARAGKRVVVLEAHQVGWGASGRNGGICSPGFSTGPDAIARRAGRADAHELHKLTIEGMHFVRRTIDELKMTSANPVHGILKTVRYAGGGAALKAQQERLARDFGYQMDFLPREAVREVLKSPCYHEALRDPHAFHFHPLNYARALAVEIERLGGKVFDGSAAVAVALDTPEKTVSTASGSVAARDVLFSCGGYTDRLVPRLRRAMIPIATYVLLSEPAPEMIATAIRTTDSVGDNRRAGDYYRLVDGGNRILWGGKITTRQAEPRDLAEYLRQAMVATYPQLATLKVEIAWSGLMSYARHLMPQIGQLQAGVWYCTAFGGHGMNTTAMGGQVVAEAITGASDRIRLFKPFDLPWNGGPFGLAAVQLEYWRLQALDWWRERAS